MEVLRAVHDEAEARSAGVVFLGDFWHARGAIPVEPLVEALDAVRAWTVPAVMIPGNHDQVTAGGETHALAPLAAANPKFVRVISRPALWRGALWLPYRRDPAALRDAVAEAKRLATLTTEHDFDAIMCHADVTGASMNERFQARDGLDPELFRSHPPERARAERARAAARAIRIRPRVFTGHYHKPHTVPGTRITYGGSPYQEPRRGRPDEGADRSRRGGGVAGRQRRGGVRRGRRRVVDETEATLPRRRPGDHGRSPGRDADPGPRASALRRARGGREGAPGARAGDVVRWTLPLSAAELPGGGGGAASEAIERAQPASASR